MVKKIFKTYSQLLRQTLCHTCAGCGQLEMHNFSGLTECKYYKFGYPEYYKSLENDYGCAVDKEKK